MTRLRSRRGLLASVAGVAAVCVLASCSSSSGSTGSSSTKAKSDTQSEAQLVAAANKEGSLNWITTFTDEQVPPMIAAFNKKYPKIKVDAIKLSSEIVPRITTEQRGGKYNVDVLSDSANDSAALYSVGALQVYDAPDEPTVQGVTLPEGYRNVVYVKSTVIAFNPTALKAAGLTPPTWEDLTKPEWKGKFSIVANSSGVDFYLGLIASLGHDKALDLIKRLGKNSPILGTSHTQVTTQVQAGEPIATATAYNYLTASLKQKTPGQIDFVNTNPLLTTVDTASLVTKAPHPNAAKLFIDWMMSPEGQDVIVGETGHASMSAGAKNDPTIWDPAKWKPAYAQPDITSDQYNTYIDEYQKALGSAQ